MKGKLDDTDRAHVDECEDDSIEESKKDKK